MAERTAFGIDLGTTMSVVAQVSPTGQPVVLPNAGGAPTTPSIVLFVPRFYTVQRTAALPTFRDVTNQSDASGAAASPAVARYAGKGVEEIGRIAASVCMQRASSRLLAAPSSAISWATSGRSRACRCASTAAGCNARCGTR